MTGTYYATGSNTHIILKDCGEDPTVCDFITGGNEIPNGMLCDAKCSRPLPDHYEIHFGGIGVIPLPNCAVICGLCPNEGIRRRRV